MSTTATADRLSTARTTTWVRNGIQRGYAAWVVVAAMVVGLTLHDASVFWSNANIASVLMTTVVLGLVALGQHVVVLGGGIDLSVGSIATLAALLTAVLIDGFPIRTMPVIVLVLVIGAAIGIAHGLLVGWAGLAPFIVTLATFYVVQGAALEVSSTPAGQVTSQLGDFAVGTIGPIPYPFVVLLLATLVVAFLLNRTVFGRHVFAVGGDADAARSIGIPVTRVLVGTYVISGVLAAVAGVMLAARATLGSPTAGEGLELSAIAVVVIGGASLLGGRGTVVGTLGGVALLALVTSSVTLLQLPSTITDLVRGLVIVAAAAVFVTKARR
ncbi:ABC transporter permease [Nocardioidaceae bacterium SCSIO 66511]|nr:ABC transporter permease [Nocardioidaceae bacterium SCSIO 66511]